MRSCYCVLIFFVLTSALYGSEENQEPISIAFVGDIFLGNWAVESLDTAGYDYPFRGCLEIFRSANLVVGNLESPLTQSNEPYIEKQFLLKSPIGVGEALYNANIRAVTLANNHILDYGVGAMKETFKQLQRYNIQYFGAGLNKEEALKEASFYFEGITFAIIGFSATFPEEFWATDSSAGTAFPYDEDIKRTIRRLSDLYDVTIVSFHWGAEKMEYPKDYQVDLAHLSIDLGADMVIGHHPHVVQGVELYKNKPIFYSLGNFAFASYGETAKIGLMVIANFVGANIESIRAIPLNVYNVQVEFQPQPIAIPKVTLPLDHLSNISLTLNQDRDIVGPDGYIAIPSE